MPRILIYGTSIFLAGLVSQIAALPGVRADACLHLADLGNLAAYDAVLVDLNNPQTSDVLQLLRARPDLTIIGVNPASGTLTVLSGQVYLAESLADVIGHLQHPKLRTEALILSIR